jgi:hypothetical protein
VVIGLKWVFIYKGVSNLGELAFLYSMSLSSGGHKVFIDKNNDHKYDI